ncbi:DUF885 domain-containing protein [Mycobacterium sp. MYCO198283]|uniref:DUF885 domain-containing protein n=1 Tax=Mycobacterium sp. MYCO198283 TaxID=2883505 RepID=UPI001E59D37C|nr:DUF885 domain-containing protein [Mycobacterium sp. MYCO198283]MCG5433653.1 DUF885 domain-containing protein [Mycobacterium sp. MYCO198283]
MGRSVTAVDEIADRYLDTLARLDPCAATAFGIAGHDDEVTDYSPAAVAERADAARAALRELGSADPADDVDRVTVAAMQERLGVTVEIADAGFDVGVLNVLDSPLQAMRDVFDLMPADSADDWAVISRRLSRIPGSAAGYAEALRVAAASATPPAGRQVARGIEQAGRIADWFAATADRMPADAPPALRSDVARHGQSAAAAYRELAGVLRDEVAPLARDRDACGRDAYRLFSRSFLGAAVDLDETYAWGVDLLRGIVAEQESIAQRRYPGASVSEAIERLDRDPRYQVHGTDALAGWMQELSDRAVDWLAGRHFEIADPLRRLECCIAPTQTGGIYYTGPSEDFSRPGRMWWSVPAGIDVFHTWRETTTVFHEGVPGHHLQIGRAVALAGELNRWRRLACWVSGHGEGWALYAERLMAEFGWLDDPGDRMGMLDAQRFRAARVVLDIGLHCELDAPDGRPWDPARAWEFLRFHCAQSDETLHFELDRYLGWPGQAPSYAIGQRIWQRLRDEALARGTDLKEFHRRALDLGGLGLDTLADALHPGG